MVPAENIYPLVVHLKGFFWKRTDFISLQAAEMPKTDIFQVKCFDGFDGTEKALFLPEIGIGVPQLRFSAKQVPATTPPPAMGLKTKSF